MSQRPYLLSHEQRNTVTSGPGQLKCVLWLDKESWAEFSALTPRVKADSLWNDKDSPVLKIGVCCSPYRLQLFEQRMLRSSFFRRFGHVEVQGVSVADRVQTQHEGDIVL